MRSIAALRLSLTVAATVLLGCRGINTVPDPVAPDAAVQNFELEIPQNLEVRNVDFSAVAYSDVSGSGGLVGSSTVGRGFLKVYAFDRGSGESVLLLYENIAKRKQPVQVIRFRPASRARGD